MTVPAVSIIIPIYNAESYLPAVIGSCQEQTFKNYELVLIDDGSQDGSRRMIDEYRAKDERIRLYCQQHSGVVRARESGLKQSRAEYVLFLDADDRLAPDSLSKLMAATEEDVDMVVGDILQIEADGQSSVISYGNEQMTNGRELFEWIVEQRVGFLWGKLIRRKRLETLNHLPYHVTFCEDLIIMLQLSYCSQTIVHVNDVVYHYYQHPLSQCNRLISRQEYADRFSNLCYSLAALVAEPLFGDNASTRLKYLFLYYCRLYLWSQGTWKGQDGLKKSFDEYLKDRRVTCFFKEHDIHHWMQLLVTRYGYPLIAPFYQILLKYKYHRIA